jgi:DNA-binding PucR family transcriptional regulator
VAARLGVHPQTARYRVTRLRELFGSALDDPDERFWLDLALRVQETYAAPGAAQAAASG